MDLNIIIESATIVERQATIQFLEMLASDKEDYQMIYAAELLRGVAADLRRGEHRK